AVLPGRPGPSRQRRGSGPRPVDRPVDRRAARRTDPRRSAPAHRLHDGGPASHPERWSAMSDVVLGPPRTHARLRPRVVIDPAPRRLIALAVAAAFVLQLGLRGGVR